jgi:hypothetical protein
MNYPHDRYQAHCQYCSQRFDADSAEEAVRLAEQHEKQCEKANQRLREPA